MGFGRKGLELDTSRGSLEGYQNRSRQAVAREEFDDDFEEAGGNALGGLKIFLIGVCVVLGVFTLDALFAGTELITPLPEGVSFYTTATGAALGLLAGFYLWMTVPSMRGIRLTLGMFLGMPLLVGGWANMVLWRVADHVAFDFSDAQWESASYPILYFDLPSRKSFGFDRYAVEIDPFDVGGNTEIPIPEWQYDQFWNARGQLCITVQQRRSESGAIQVLTDGSLTMNEPQPANIHLC